MGFTKMWSVFFFFLGVMPHVMRRSYSPFPVAGATLMIILKRKI